MEELKEEKVQKRKMRLWVKLLILLFVLVALGNFRFV